MRIAMVFLLVAVAVATSGMKKHHEYDGSADMLMAMVSEVRTSDEVTMVTIEVDTVNIQNTTGPSGVPFSYDIGLVNVVVYYDTIAVSVPPMVLDLQKIAEYGIRDTVYLKEKSGD